MMKCAFIFPGQGAQHTGMGKEIYDNFKVAKDLFEQASDALHLDMAALCFEESSELNDTRNTQPALLTVSTACANVIIHEFNLLPAATAGLSLGEYTALVVGGAMDFCEALLLVQQRGLLMEQAAKGKGSMSALLGLADEQVLSIVDEAAKTSSVWACNFNNPGQIIVGGSDEGVKLAGELAKEAGARVMPLNVSGPFHTPLLIDAAKGLEPFLQDTAIREPEIPVYSNVTAQPHKDPETIRDLLIQQVTSPVRWAQTMQNIFGEGILQFIAPGPAKSLIGMHRKTLKKPAALCVNDLASLDKLSKLEEKNE